MELKTYWEILLRRKWVIAGAVFLSPLFTLLIFLITPSIYQSKAKLLIKTDNFKQMFIENVPKQLGQITFTDPDKIMNSVEEMLESAPVVEKVIHKLNLHDNDGRLLKITDFIDPSLATLFLKRKGVDIENLSVSEIFEIRGYSTDPIEAKQISDEVIRNFSTEISSEYNKGIAEVRKILEKRLWDVNDRFIDAAKTISEFKFANQLYNISTQINTSISQMDSLGSEKDKAIRSLEEAKASLKSIREASWTSQQDFKDIQINIDSNPLIEDYKKQLVNLEMNIARLKIERTQEHPDLKIANEQIDIIKRNIKEEISKSIVSQIEGRVPFLDNIIKEYVNSLVSIVESTVRVKALEEQIKEKQVLLDKIPEKERKLNDLNKEVDALKATYNSIFSDIETMKSVEDLDLTNAIIVQPAAKGVFYFPPSPDDYELFLAIAAAAGIPLGIFFAFLFDYLDGNLKTQEEIRRFLNQETVILLPKTSNSQLNIRGKDISPFAEYIYNLFARLNIFKGEKACQVISVVSTIGGSGNSTVATHTAYTLAQGGKKLLLVDGNLRKPILHKMFNLSIDNGLSNYLSNDIKTQNIIRKTFENNLDIITAGSLQIDNPQKNLQSSKFAKLLGDIKEHYDYIFVDTPSFSVGDDALIISSYTQKAILVVRQGKTQHKVAKEFVNILNKANVEILGVVTR